MKKPGGRHAACQPKAPHCSLEPGSLSAVQLSASCLKALSTQPQSPEVRGVTQSSCPKGLNVLLLHPLLLPSVQRMDTWPYLVGGGSTGEACGWESQL